MWGAGILWGSLLVLAASTGHLLWSGVWQWLLRILRNNVSDRGEVNPSEYSAFTISQVVFLAGVVGLLTLLLHNLVGFLGILRAPCFLSIILSLAIFLHLDC